MNFTNFTNLTIGFTQSQNYVCENLYKEYYSAFNMKVLILLGIMALVNFIAQHMYKHNEVFREKFVLYADLYLWANFITSFIMLLAFILLN